MKLAVLTTETTHHVHFVRAVNEAFEIALIISEAPAPPPPFPTAHPFEDQRDRYECQVLLEGKDVMLADVAEALQVKSSNDPAAIDALRNLQPDVVVVFGTGRLRREVIEVCPERMVNLHGGDPEHYRGLDTHLWAIYHRQFDQLVTTLHGVNEELDAGDVILQTAVRIEPSMPLCQLRANNTQACVELTVGALDMLRRLGRFPRRPQREIGRSYSFMPAALKEICAGNFETYTKGLER